MVNHPPHYAAKDPEPIDLIESWGLSFHEANVVKYLARWRTKNGLEDLRKAQWYLNRLIEWEIKNGQAQAGRDRGGGHD